MAGALAGISQDLNDLAYFAQVVDHGGFAPAARVLGISKSKLSRRVAQLEARLGVRLLQRSTRRFSITEVGAAFYRHCKAIIVEAQAAEASIARATDQPRGTVRLACPVALLPAVVADMLIEFMAANSLVELHVQATNRRVDIIGEGFDLAIRARTPPLEDSNLVMRELAQRDLYLVASPAMCERYPKPVVPADLEHLPSLSSSTSDRKHTWQLQGPAGAAASIVHRPRLVADDLHSLLKAAIAGLGVAQLPAMTMGEALRNGSLIKLLPDWCSKGAVVHAVYPSRCGLLPAVRALIDFLALKFNAATDN